MRRTLLKGALIAAAAAMQAGRGVAAGSSARPIRWRLFDGTRSASRAWLATGSGPAIDVADDAANRWKRVRGLTREGRVAGMTTWSDFVQVRGRLQELGLRLCAESRSGDLFYWEMA